MSVKFATPGEVSEILEHNDAALYLDVRTEQEFAAGHPRGAINVPAFVPTRSGSLQQNPEFVEVVRQIAAPDRPLICGCQAGGRSMAAAQLLERAGYLDVTNVVGGFGGGRDPRSGAPVAGWRQAGLPVSYQVPDDVAYATLRRKAGLA